MLFSAANNFVWWHSYDLIIPEMWDMSVESVKKGPMQLVWQLSFMHFGNFLFLSLLHINQIVLFW
jgi:hypothetical protein